MRETLLRLQDALIESTKPSRQCIQTTSFIVMLTPNDPLVWVNYAVPTSEADPENVDEMVACFRSANRTPRLEFFADLWPTTMQSLDQRDFICEKRMPIMILRREDWKGLKYAHNVQSVDHTKYHELNYMLGEAFGMEGGELKTDDPSNDPSFQRVANGFTLASVALVDGIVVGGGFGVGTPTIREIAGIGTAASHRKQGIASAVIAHLLDQFFGDQGEIAWLTPGDDTAQSVYTNLGFKTIAEQVVYSMP